MAEVFLPHDWFPRPVPPNAEIGERSWLYSSFAMLHCRSQRTRALQVGKDSGLYNGTFLELGACGEVMIGDYCTLVGAVIRTDRRVVIEDFVFISHEVVIADSFAAVPPLDVGAADDSSAPAISVIVRRNAWVGTRAILLCGADIGEGAIVGAGAVVDFAVPAFAIVAGNPANIVGWSRPRESS